MRAIITALLAAGIAAGSAHAADALPVLGVDVGSEGVTTQQAQVRYVTIPEARVTIVAQTARDGGRIVGLAFPRATTTFAVLDAPQLRLTRALSGLRANAGGSLVLALLLGWVSTGPVRRAARRLGA